MRRYLATVRTRRRLPERANTRLSHRLAGLDLLSQPRKLGDFNAQGGGDPPNGTPCRILAGLNVAKPRWVQVGTVGDLLLGEAASGSGLSDGLPEGDLWIGAWSHARNRRGRSHP